MTKSHNSIFLFILIIAFSCGPARDNKAFKSLSSKDQNKFEKYLIQGRSLYTTHCLPCHQADGNGLKKLIPPLAGADYLKNNQIKSVHLIKYGATQSIIVNGIDYLPTMPPQPALSNLEIAEIMTYINNSWGNEYGFIDSKKVKEYLE